MDLISVIVPVYNVEKYLKQCIESIIHQTYQNLEIILVDDGSPDNCGVICDEYAKQDKRIKVIHQENGGLSSARNAGLDIATGEYISFIDSDDYIAANFMEYLYQICIHYHVDIAECDFLRFNNNIKINELSEEIEVLNKIAMSKRINKDYVARTVIVCNKIFKRYIYQKLRFPVGKINEDEYITYKAFDECQTNIVISNQQLYYYRINEESIMQKGFNVKRLSILDALKERKLFYQNKKEMELFELTVERYQDFLKKYYILTERNIKNAKDYLIKMRKDLNINLKDYWKLKHINWKMKIKMSIFCKMPELYCKLIKIKDRSYDNYDT